MEVLIKRLNNLKVKVSSIDFENENLSWFDGQYSRTDPPEKAYELERFEDVIFLNEYSNLNKRLNPSEIVDKIDSLVYQLHETEYTNERDYMIAILTIMKEISQGL